MIWFILGLFIGGGLLVGLYISARRDLVRIDEEKQLLEQEQHLVMEFMHELVESVGEGVERGILFQQIVHASILGTGATCACFFERAKKDRLRGVAVEGLFPPLRTIQHPEEEKHTTRAKFIEDVLKSEVFEMGEGLVGSVAQTGEGIFVADAANEPRLVKHADDALLIHSIMLMPLKIRDNIMGVLAVANPADGSMFTESDFSLLESLAEQASMAVHNADLMALQIEKNKLDLDLSLASSIQRMLLPQNFPESEKLQIDAHYKPAQQVGGDLYDVFEISPGRIGLAIADVSGKGIPASLLMAICQTNLRHFSRQIESPSGVLRAMNHELMNEMRQDMFITLIYAIIDMNENTITIARAGHELPILYTGKDNGNIELISSEGMALGMVPSEIFDVVISDKTIGFNPGDIFVLYTDGVTETINDEEQEFSNTRLCETVTTLNAHPPAVINGGILDTLKRFAGKQRPTDDITLITLKHL